MTKDDLSRPPPSGLLFLCVANSARSQMAEGFARFIGPSDMKYYSAGSAPTLINPFAVKAMEEVGIDISGHRAKSLSEIPIEEVSTVVTLCAEEECPVLPAGVHHLAWPLEDPADVRGDEEEVLQVFRRVRDQIRELVSRLF
ncbi:arsenate reductase ArsC [Haliangium sp.]|uniref:arsenate reductase ArsC n=1 Tax=Haliangium sp. TaxID=2663208 RepID=UPI003D0DD54D